jgi:NAD(P)-dependent dehydrogenase (short-subunit alcohol dehydrogenase family)
MRFEGRRVLVTGGSRGIGRGIVEAFVEEGATVLVTDIDGAPLETIREAFGDRVLTEPADLRDASAPAALVRSCVERLGGLDVVVNNAGVQPDGPVLEVDAETFEEAFAVNVRAPFVLMQEACRHWTATNARGAIVNVSSANAFQNESPESVYNASKAALVALTRAFAHEMGHHGIRVNGVAPGETITPETEREIASDREARRVIHRYLGRIPLRHAGTPRDQAMAVLFLASDDARFITGQTLIVDGGETGGGRWYDEADAPPLPPDDAPLTG